MRRKALQAVIAARNDHLLGAGIALQCTPIIEYLVSRLDKKQIVAGGNAWRVAVPPLLEVLLSQLVGLARMEVLLRAEVGAQAHVRIDRGIDQDCASAVLFREPGRIEPAQRGTDEAERLAFLLRHQPLDLGDCLAGERRKRWAGVVGPPPL